VTDIAYKTSIHRRRFREDNEAQGARTRRGACVIGGGDRKRRSRDGAHNKTARGHAPEKQGNRGETLVTSKKLSKKREIGMQREDRLVP